MGNADTMGRSNQSEIETVITAHRARLQSGDKATRQELVRRWREVERALEADLVDLAERVSVRHGGVWTLNDLREERRFRTLLHEIRREIDKYADDANEIISRTQQRFLIYGLADSRKQISMLYDGTFTYLPSDAMTSMVGMLGDGTPLHDILRDIDSKLVDALGQRLINGVARGKHPNAIADDMNNVLGQSLYRSLTIARTESLRVYNLSTHMQYRESGVVTAWQRRETKDHRCCPACLVMDGTIYSLDVVWHDHVNGRGTLIPVLDEQTAKRRPTAWQWFQSLPESDQRDIIGDRRYDLWKDGMDPIRFARIVDDPRWGPSLQVTPLSLLSH